MRALGAMVGLACLLAGGLACGPASAPDEAMVQVDPLVKQTRALKAERVAHPDDPALALELGNVLAKRGLYDAAIAQYTSATELQPAHAAAWHNLGLCYEKLGAYAKASTAYAAAAAAEADPTNEFFASESERLAVRRRSEADGERAFAKRLALCQLALRRGTPTDLAEAHRQAEQLLIEFPHKGAAWNAAGQVASIEQNAALAAERFDRALELEPGMLDARYNRAILAWSQEDRARAATELHALANLVADDGRAAKYVALLQADLAAGLALAEARIEAERFVPASR